MSEVVGRLRSRIADQLGYLERNQAALVPYAVRFRRGKSISTALVESAIDEVVSGPSQG